MRNAAFGMPKDYLSMNLLSFYCDDKLFHVSVCLVASTPHIIVCFTLSIDYDKTITPVNSLTGFCGSRPGIELDHGSSRFSRNIQSWNPASLDAKLYAPMTSTACRGGQLTCASYIWRTFRLEQPLPVLVKVLHCPVIVQFEYGVPGSAAN
jgi:hypothetical protein